MKLSPQIVLSLSIISSLTFGTRVFATSPEPSAVPDVVTENLKERLIETINNVAEVNAQVSLMGYVGKVRDIVQDTIVLEDKSGKKNILIAGDANIVRSPGNTTIKLENVRIDDGIIAMGEPIQDSDELQGKRIIVSDSHFSPPAKTSGIATITAQSKNTLTLTALNTGNPISLTLNSKTIYKTNSAALSSADLAEGDTVVYSAIVDPKDPTTLTATIIMRVKEADPVASPSPID